MKLSMEEIRPSYNWIPNSVYRHPEKFSEIPGYDGAYVISTYGRVASMPRMRDAAGGTQKRNSMTAHGPRILKIKEGRAPAVDLHHPETHVARRWLVRDLYRETFDL